MTHWTQSLNLTLPLTIPNKRGLFELNMKKLGGFSGEDADPIGLSHTNLNGISC